MTWINSDLNKIAKQIEMDVTKFHYDTPYSVRNGAGGTTAYTLGWCPFLFGNKQIISGVDFLTVYTYTGATPNIPYFKIADFNTATYIYIFDLSFNYKGFDANEAIQRCFYLSSNATVDKIWNIGGLPSPFYSAHQVTATAGADDACIGFDNYFTQVTQDYTVDVTNPEKTRCIFFLGGSTTGGAGTGLIGANFSFVVRNQTTNAVSTYAVGTISNVMLTVKRIKKV